MNVRSEKKQRRRPSDQRLRRADDILDAVSHMAFWLIVVLGVCVILSGCAYVFPNTAAAIAPEGATVGEAALGLLADFEMWIETVGGWIAYLFGG